MSTNRPSTKPDPRIAQKEAMVTRRKSAQMKRQLRTKDRSMKRFTDLLKSPTKETQPKTTPVKKKHSPKAKQSLLKSAEKVQNLPQKTFKLSKVIRKEVILIPDEEYYPDKLKRKLAIRKVVLKPKNALKLVGEITGSVKRKCGIPVKASEKPRPGSQEPSPVHTRQSMAEAMSIMEEQLTDEDLMEILTCPSPVWWEDPPDEEYIEDAIFTRSKSQPPAPAKPMAVEMENDKNRFITIPNLSSKSDKFLKKRSKIEDLLANIKDKSKTAKRNSTKDMFNEDVVVLCSNYRTDTDELKVNNNNEISSNGESDSRRSESDDEIMFHDSINEDELLKDLENMDIPIDNRGQSNEVIVIDDDDDIDLDKTTRKEGNVKNTKVKNHEITAGDNSVEPVILNAHRTNKDKMSKDEALSNRELNKEMSSPKSFDSFSSKSSVVFVQDADTVSDTNVKFVEDHIDGDEGLLDSKENPSQDNTNKTNYKETKESDKEAVDDNVTVYQIIEEVNDDTSVKYDPDFKTILETHNEDMSKEKVNTNEKSSIRAKVNDYYKETSKEANIDEEMPCIVATKTSDYNKIKIEKSNDYKNLVEAKLSDCYKKCKKVYQRRPKKDEKSDINRNDVIQNAEEIDNFPTMFCDPCRPSFKRVSEDENVKYCLNCSSIFDTKDCTYCTKKFKNKIFICIPCKIKFCCDNFYKIHEKQGCSYNTISRKVVFTQLPDKGICDGSPNVQVINYSVSVDTVDTGS